MMQTMGQFTLFAVLFMGLIPNNVSNTSSPPTLILTIHGDEGRRSESPIVPIGDTFALQCTVENKPQSSADGDNIYGTVWFKDSKHFATDGKLNYGQQVLDESRSTMVQADSTLHQIDGLEVDSLTIFDFKESDQGNYTCQLFLFKKYTESIVVLSQSINIYVFSPTTHSPSTHLQTLTPLARKMTCSASNIVASLGDVITLECETDSSDELMYWTIEGSDSAYNGQIESTSTSTKMTMQFVMDLQHNDKSFTCHMKNTVGTESVYESCMVGPFAIIQPTPATKLPNVVTKSPGKTFNHNRNMRIFEGYLFVIVVIAAMFILCCLICLGCYCCCYRMRKQGQYTFGKIVLSVKRKSSVSTSSRTADMTLPALPQSKLAAIEESPYYSSIDEVTSSKGHGNIYKNPSSPDGASNNPLYDSEAVYETTGNIIYSDGYVGLRHKKDTAPNDKRLYEHMVSNNDNLNELSKNVNLSESRSGQENDSNNTVSEMKGPNKAEPPYYLTVFSTKQGAVKPVDGGTKEKGVESVDEGIKEHEEANNDVSEIKELDTDKPSHKEC